MNRFDKEGVGRINFRVIECVLGFLLLLMLVFLIRVMYFELFFIVFC